MDEAILRRIERLESDLEHLRDQLERSDSNYHHNYFKLVQSISDKELELQRLKGGQSLYQNSALR